MKRIVLAIERYGESTDGESISFNQKFVMLAKTTRQQTALPSDRCLLISAAIFFHLHASETKILPFDVIILRHTL